MTFRDLIRRVRGYQSRRKQTLDSYLDPLMSWVAVNGAYLYGMDQLLDKVSNYHGNHEDLALATTWISFYGGLIAVNKYVVAPIAGTIRRFHQNQRANGRPARAGSWLKTVGLAGALVGAVLCDSGQKVLDDFKWDIDAQIHAHERIEAPHVKETPIKSPELDYLMPAKIKKIPVEDYNPDSKIGRFYRMYRWDEITSEVEKKYGLEKGILAGLGMAEGGGNPLAINLSDDGGAGMFQFQPGTARNYGLKTFDGSKSMGRDRNHGAKLVALMKRYGFDYEGLRKKDQRFDIALETDAAGRMMKDLIKRYGSVPRAL